MPSASEIPDYVPQRGNASSSNSSGQRGQVTPMQAFVSASSAESQLPAAVQAQQAKRQQQGFAEQSPRAPTDPEIVKAIHNLASFVARHGRKFEETVRNKNQHDPKFRCPCLFICCSFACFPL